MSEQAQHLLTLVENGYTIDEIKTKSNIKMQELFAYFTVILKYQIEINLVGEMINIETVGKIIEHMDELVDSKEVPKSIGIKKIKNCKTQLECAAENSTADTEFINTLNASLDALEIKIKEEKRQRHFDEQYKEFDRIIFEKRDLEETKLLLKDKKFNINYVNKAHLMYFLVEEYTESLKEGTDLKTAAYYRNLIDYILVIPKFKLTALDKASLNYEMTKTIEKVKRNKMCKNKKTIMNHLNNLINKLKNKDLVLFTTHTEKSHSGNRKNLTNEYTITIDNSDTKIFDDALTVRSLKNGNYMLGVHIADANSMLSNQLVINDQLLALIRDNSQTIPSSMSMFKNYPVIHDLSLKRSQPRPTNSLLVEITKKGEVVNYEFVKGIIKVNENLTFGEVYKKLKNKDTNEELYTLLDNLIKVTGALREKNQTKEIYTGLKILSRDSKPLNNKCFDIQTTQFNYGRMAVQESMILYNQLLASYFVDMEYPFIYKNRDNSEDVFGNADEVNKVVERLKQSNYPNDKIIAALISLYPETEYSIVNKGNSALQVDHYCNSTSPLRYANDKLAAMSLDRCYFKKPKDKELYVMEDVYQLLTGYMTKTSKQIKDEEVVKIKQLAINHLNQIRNN